MSISKLVGRGADQYTVRFPEGLRDKLKEAAAANGRSMNSEIIERLSLSLESDYRNKNTSTSNFISKSYNMNIEDSDSMGKLLNEIMNHLKPLSEIEELFDNYNKSIQQYYEKRLSKQRAAKTHPKDPE